MNTAPPQTNAAPWPLMIPARQRFVPASPLDLDRQVRAALTPLLSPISPGANVAVAVGSRGITGLATIVGTTIEALRAMSAKPFIVPAMGSHGGGTPEGQTALLADYGITEAALGVPVRATMEVRLLDTTPEGVECVSSTAALAADHVLLINRIKPHTDFHSRLGSGLLKMLVVGLGKHEGARRFHAAADRIGYEPTLRSMSKVLLPRLPLFGGLAILENQRHETVRLVGVPPAEFAEREEILCAEAVALMPRLPFDDVDLLIVDRMGKNLSGTGMDPALIGRMIHGYSTQIAPGQPPPRVRRLFVRNLTPESHGNAIGLGMADFTTDRLVAAMDPAITRVNALTALSLQGAKVPIHFPTDREALTAALQTLCLPNPAQARVIRIRNTLDVERLEYSVPLRGAARADCPLEETGPARSFDFDADGNLLSLEMDC